MIEVMIEPQLQTNTTARCVAQDDCSTVGAGLLVSSGSASSISPGFHPDLRIRNITDTDNYGEQHTQFYMEGKTAVVTAVAPGKCLAAVLCTPETGCGGVLGPNETAWTLLFSAEMSPESSGGVVPSSKGEKISQTHDSVLRRDSSLLCRFRALRFCTA